MSVQFPKKSKNRARYTPILAISVSFDFPLRISELSVKLLNGSYIVGSRTFFFLETFWKFRSICPRSEIFARMSSVQNIRTGAAAKFYQPFHLHPSPFFFPFLLAQPTIIFSTKVQSSTKCRPRRT